MKLIVANLRHLLVLVLLCTVAWLTPYRGRAQTALEYQRRGDHFEGIRPSPVSGFDLELLAGVVEHTAQPERVPDKLTLKFFADRSDRLWITVREIDNSHFYWLDRVIPKVPWSIGSTNSFRWDATTVLQRIAPPLRVGDLGAVLRVGRSEPSAEEHILPVALVATTGRVKVDAYRFSFKPCCDVNVVCSLHAGNAEEALSTQVFRRTPGGRPFTWRVDATKLPAGEYRLVVRGYLTETNQHIHQVVRFTHRPVLE